METREVSSNRGDGSEGPAGGWGGVASVALLVGSVAAVIAGAAIWLLLTDPVVVANSVENGEVTPFIQQLAGVLYEALLGLLKYF